MFRLQFQLFVYVFMVACGSNVSDRKAVPSFDNTCRAGQSDSGQTGSLKIAGGYKTDEFPSVVDMGHCTGTFIASNILLTAAHCVKGKDTIKISYEGNAYQSSLAIAHPNFTGNFRGKDNTHDIGLVIFDQKISKHLSKIDPVRPPDGSDIDIVGFGGAGGKSYGKNILLTEPDLPGFRFDTSDYLTIKGSDREFTRAVSEPGDSGGPMLYQGNIVGVTSGGDSLARGLDFSVYPSLAQIENRSFIDETVKLYSLDSDKLNPENPKALSESKVFSSELESADNALNWLDSYEEKEISGYLGDTEDQLKSETVPQESGQGVSPDHIRDDQDLDREKNRRSVVEGDSKSPASVYTDGEIIISGNEGSACI